MTQLFEYSYERSWSALGATLLEWGDRPALDQPQVAAGAPHPLQTSL